VAYFVIGDDGQKYGPADVATLNQWIAEARLIPTQVLEDEASGQRMAAGSVPGLNFPAPAPPPGPGGYGGGQPYQQHYARPPGFVGDGGQSDLNQAWIFAGLSLICCAPVTAWLAFNAAKRAEGKGAQNTQGPKILAAIGLVLFVAWMLFNGYMAINRTSIAPSFVPPPVAPQ
jgi:hypothetical protein